MRVVTTVHPQVPAAIPEGNDIRVGHHGPPGVDLAVAQPRATHAPPSAAAGQVGPAAGAVLVPADS